MSTIDFGWIPVPNTRFQHQAAWRLKMAKNRILQNFWQNTEQCGEFTNQLPKCDTEEVIFFETPLREHVSNEQFRHIICTKPRP